MKRLTFALLILILPAIAFAAEKQKKQTDLLSLIYKNDPVYMFSYFTGNGEDGLHLAYSQDGLMWKALNNGQSLLKPTVGESRLMRDPSIVRDSKGIYHMVWTAGWTEKGIGYASSKDLITWSEQKYLPVMEHEPTTLNAWAPEVFYNKCSHTFYIIWASTIPGRFPENGKGDDKYNHRLYYTTTKDFVKFSPTKLFYDPGFNCIDACILKKGCKYYMFLKNETKDPAEKNIRMVSSMNLKKFPVKVSGPISDKRWSEGPTAIQIGDYTYIYWDLYTSKKYGGVRTKSLRKPVWENITDMVSFPAGMRHGTVFHATEKDLYKLQQLEKAAQ